MTYKKIDLENAEIYLIKDKKFKTVKIHTLLINPLDFKNFTKERLLSNCLGRSTKKFKTELDLSKEYLALYDPGVRIYESYLKNHIKTFSLNMLNEKYTEKDMTKKTIDFYFDFIFNPNTSKNKFDETNFNLSKNSLKLFYKSKKENTDDIAINNAFSLIDEEIPIKYDTTGNEEELNNISNEELYKFYKDELKNSQFKIFVIGDFDDEEMLNIIKENIKDKINKNTYENNDYVLTNHVEKVVEKEDSENINQSKIIYIYKALNLSKRERQYIFVVFNSILGNSKLYKKVREEKSLAYGIFSSFNASSGYMYINAGISKENVDEVKNEIENQVNEMKKGNITDKEINRVKQELITKITACDDNQGNVLTNIKNNVLYSDDYEVDKIISEINSVTKEEIIEFGKKLELSVIYFLRGDK